MMISSKLVVQKAGAIILSGQDKDKICLIYRGEQNDWSFPKGRIELGESAKEAMVREVKEETGLTAKVVRALPDLDYVTSSGKQVDLKMFLAVSEDDSLLKTEFGQDSVQWISCRDVEKKLSRDNLKEYFSSVLDLLFID